MYVLVGALLISFLLSARRISNRAKIFAIVMMIPFVVYILNYATARNLQTTSEEIGETSLVYRYVELGLGFEKLSATNAWIFGAGYADGFVNPFAQIGGIDSYYLHNGYASIVYNYGITGGVAWLALIAAILVFLTRHLKDIRSNTTLTFLTFYLVGQLAANYSSGIFNRERNATFCFLFAFSLLERSVQFARDNGRPRRSLPVTCPPRNDPKIS